jgi:hypothetical protein
MGSPIFIFPYPFTHLHSSIYTLAYRRIAVWTVLRGKSWQQYYLESVVLVDSNALGFGARLFDSCVVRISLRNFKTSVILAPVPPNLRQGRLLKTDYGHELLANSQQEN